MDSVLSSIGVLIGCALSVIIGIAVAVLGSGFILMAAVFGIASFGQMPYSEIAKVSLALFAMVSVEALVLNGAFKGATTYCPVLWG